MVHRALALWGTLVLLAVLAPAAAPAAVCGNGVRELPEDCDGADASRCQGLCTDSCTCPPPVCGNNVSEVGEACDGTSNAGCDGAPCLATCTCNRVCPATPEPSCRQAGARASVLTIRDQAGRTTDSLTWTWNRGEATSVEDFGDPRTDMTQTALCLWDASGNRLHEFFFRGGAQCYGKSMIISCWKAIASGFKYAERQVLVEGYRTMTLKAGAAGKAVVKAKLRGTPLATPALPLTLPVTVQLLVRTPTGTACFGTPFADALHNDASSFKAIGP